MYKKKGVRMLQLQSIRKNYYVGDLVINALKGLNLDFRKNEFVAILGPSGCGKTTLMNIIGGLDQYTSGDLLINGKSTKDFKDKDWDNYRNKKIGFVFQSYNLIPHQTVIGNVELALTLSGISSEERHEKAKDALNKVGLGDQLFKKPNQLSGGQMQRVAIARAIVNSPDILLMDEPTGALDTATSKQIMDLITEVSKDKLVIMVTHNPDLALSYANRVIKMLDGIIIEDSNPYNSSKDPVFINEVKQLKLKDKSKKKAIKTSMSFKTALKLSLRNLFTKKGRTILTAIAGSIGIIGVALILAISSGMNEYIDKIQMDTLSSNPITISATTFDLNQAMNASRDSKVWDLYPEKKEVYIQEVIDASHVMKKNKITAEFIDYVKNIDKELYNDILFKTGLEFHIFGIKTGQTSYSEITNTKQSQSSMSMNGIAWQMLLNEDFIKSQYTMLDGLYPTKANEIMLIVDEYNRVPENILFALGFTESDTEIEAINFSDIIGKEFKFVSNDQYYNFNGTKFNQNSPLDINFDEAYSLKIVGIFRQNKETEMGVMASGIGYTEAFYNLVQDTNYNSAIVKWMNDFPTLDPDSGMEYQNSPLLTKEEQRSKKLRELGGDKLPNEISIYPIDFKTKESIKTVLSNYNLDKSKEEAITYLDMSELISTMFGSMVDVITYVLIGFTSISLIVSSIMIAIITYVSVLERTKEIGILRSIGARKKDITRVFNAETFLIGLLAGIIGVGVTYLLSIPINIIVKNLTDVGGIASLSIPSGVVLILISIGLTVLSGLIPARGASKKDPVLALRTE